MFLRIIRYFRVVTDIPELEFYGQGNNHYFVIHVPDEVQPESIDAFISVLFAQVVLYKALFFAITH